MTTRIPPVDGEAAVDHLRRVEPRFRAVIDHAGPYAPERRPYKSLFEALGRAIVYQQLNGVAAGTIHARYMNLFAERTPEPKQLLTLSDAKLRGAGLSGAKTAAVRDLARRIASGELPTLRELPYLDDDVVLEKLTAVRGVGPWTVHMLLLFHLRRPDVLPTGDYGVRSGYAALFKKRALPTEKALTLAAKPWRPYRSVASWYLWRVKLLGAVC
ncbi:DNA-3-methyladenine glycosylase [soil metagenome]